MKLMMIGVAVGVAVCLTGQVWAQDSLSDVHAEARPSPAPKKIKKRVAKKAVKKAPAVRHRSTPKPSPEPFSQKEPSGRTVSLPPTTIKQVAVLPPPEEGFRYKKVRIGEDKEWGLDLGLHYFESLGDNPNPGISFSPTVIYQLNPDNSLAAAMEYRTKFDAKPYDGWKDLDLTYTYSNLYTNPTKDFNLSFDVDGMFPTSQESQNNSMLFGTGFTFRMTKKSGPFKIKFDNSLYAYDFQYTTPATGNDINSPFSILNKVGVSWQWFKNFNWSNSFGYFTIQNFSGSTTNLYQGSTGFNYTFSGVTVDLVYKYKNGELNDLELMEGRNYSLYTGMTAHF
jgi:hypothetical protein